MTKKTKSAKPKTKKTKPLMARGRALMLRTCNADMTAHGGFVWPTSGEVKAPDWSSVKECGRGLHGLLWGRGDWGLLNLDTSAVWMAVEIVASEVVDLGGKVKVPRGWVVCVGKREDVLEYIARRLPAKLRPKQISTSGYGGQATASGDGGQATASGDGGQATASGYGGQATASGERGEALALGSDGIAAAGTNGMLLIWWYDGVRRRVAVGYVGEGIKPLTRYCVDGAGAFVELGPVDVAVKAVLP
jgi:hypothetical protein